MMKFKNPEIGYRANMHASWIILRIAILVDKIIPESKFAKKLDKAWRQTTSEALWYLRIIMDRNFEMEES